MRTEDLRAQMDDSYGQSFDHYIQYLKGNETLYEAARQLFPRIESSCDWEKYRAIGKPIFDEAVSKFPPVVSQDIYREIRKSSPDIRSFADSVFCYSLGSNAKFALIEPWLKDKLAFLCFLGLQHSTALSVIDLGCGAGHFGLLCRAAGHDFTGIDIADPIFAQITPPMGTEYVDDPVHPRFFQTSYASSRFDLITGFLINFNIESSGSVWREDGWATFLEGAISSLNPGGRICFLLNTQTSREGLIAADGSLQRFLQSCGFKIYNNGGAYPGPRVAIFTKAA